MLANNFRYEFNKTFLVWFSIDLHMFWCISCLRSWTRKEDFIKHFKLQQARDARNHFVPNQCFNKPVGNFAKSLDEAKMLKKSSGVFQTMFQKRPRDANEETPAFCERRPPIPHVSDGERAGPSSEHHGTPVLTTNVSQLGNPTLVQDNNSGHLGNQQSSSGATGIHSPPPTTPGSVEPESVFNTFSQTFAASLEVIMQGIEHITSQQDTLIQSITNSQSTESGRKSSDDLFAEHLLLITHAKKMEDIISNPLVADIFKMDRVDNKMYCQVCSSPRNLQAPKGIGFDDADYCQSVGSTMAQWFSNFKKVVVKHIDNGDHLECVAFKEAKIKKIMPLKAEMRIHLRYLAYYIIKTNTAFQLYPALLAVAERCKVYTGNINNSRIFLSDLTDYINKILTENTKKWFENQVDITLVADIGTFLGLVITVVIFVGDKGVVKLASCRLTISKRGSDLAELIMHAVLVDVGIPDACVKEKTRGVCADGAFIKGNEPFKQKMRELLANDDLIFKWDFMHILNRAHCKARGLTDSEIDSENTLRDESDIDDEPRTLSPNQKTALTTLMDYIQSQSKKWRSGLDYTALVEETRDTFSFKRPKVMSTTRVSLYEFEQVHRFLECKQYWDVPWDKEILAQMYCVVIFAVKIMMKKVQRTDVQSQYIVKVFTVTEDRAVPEGKVAMKLALSSVIDFMRGRSILSLRQGQGGDILNTGTRDDVNFRVVLHEFITKNGQLLKPAGLINPTPRTRGQASLTFEGLAEVVYKFIDEFWLQVEMRLSHTNVSDSLVCFSEAPAESFFSVWQTVIDHRPNLSFGKTAALVRIIQEGPAPGTVNSHDLVKKALQLHMPSHLGERYVTEQWEPPMVCKEVAKQMRKPWKFAAFSDLS